MIYSILFYVLKISLTLHIVSSFVMIINKCSLIFVSSLYMDAICFNDSFYNCIFFYKHGGGHLVCSLLVLHLRWTIKLKILVSFPVRWKCTLGYVSKFSSWILFQCAFLCFQISSNMFSETTSCQGLAITKG